MVGSVTPSGVNIPPAKVPPVNPVPVTISTWVGSMNHTPGFPKGALALTLIPEISRLSLPEVSINPPLPPKAPPLVLIVPKKRAVLFAQAITLPPLALPIPLALIRVLVSAKVNWAVGIIPCPRYSPPMRTVPPP